MKVVGIVGSPRKNGNTEILTAHTLKAIADEGVDTELIRLAGLDIREGDLTYNLQAGRNFGNLTARAGSIRSKAGVGLDYWPFSKRIGISLEGVDITDRHPEVDLNVAVRFLGSWYFILGAEYLTGSDSSDTGFNFGLRTEVGQ